MASFVSIPDENPTRIDHAGFYRRWLSMIEDMKYLQSYVDRVSGTNEEEWVPLWRKLEKTMRAKVINLKQKESSKKQENASCKHVHITL